MSAFNGEIWYNLLMAEIPKTSVSLLTVLANDTANARWFEFYNAYEGPMRAFLASKYPALEADDIVQETMIALVKRLPTYHYTPDERGHFHNYLIGILDHKAADAVRRYKRQIRATQAAQTAAETAAPQEPPPYAEDEAWMNAAREAAIDQLMADDSLAPNTRMIFEHVVLLHEPPEAVAATFGTTRNNVDQIKSRLTARLNTIIEAMTKEND